MANLFKTETYPYLLGLQRFGWRLGLQTISELARAVGEPHRDYTCVHVAGTNGKGTTVALLESICRQAGYRTGMYTSPHLVNVTERICVNGQEISDEDLHKYVTEMRPDFDSLQSTFFEALTAIAMKYFSDRRVDIAFFEVGLGGNYDATNIILPVLSVITAIDFDHTQHLGQTLAQIAQEKCGIIKPGVPCLTQTQLPEAMQVLRQVCQQRNARLFEASKICQLADYTVVESGSRFKISLNSGQMSDLYLPLAGRVQLNNATLAIAAAALLEQEAALAVPDYAIQRGIEQVRWPGRLQKVSTSPAVVVDVAHNPAAIEQLIHGLTDLYRFEKLIFVIGILKDKNYRDMVKLIAAKADHIFAVMPLSDRGLPAEILARVCREYTEQISILPDFRQGMSQVYSQAGDRGLICITGSHFVVGEFLNFHKNT